MARIGGNPGNKGGGRRKENDNKIQQFKRIAWAFIVKRCTDRKNGEKYTEEYIKLFANKLMPQEITGNDGGAIQIEINDDKYADIIRRESGSFTKGS